MCLMFVLSLNTSAVAQRTQTISDAVTHQSWSGACATCVDVQFLFDYTDNGVGYSQISAIQTLAPGNNGNFSVSIPASAVVVGEKFKFTSDSGVIIHKFANGFAQHVLTPNSWCTGSCYVTHFLVDVVLALMCLNCNRFQESRTLLDSPHTFGVIFY